MHVEFQFYTTLRDAVGDKAVTRHLTEGETVESALQTVPEEYEGLQSLLFGSESPSGSHVTVALDGNPLIEDRAGVTLSEGDTLVLSPGVSGGSPEAKR